MTVICVLKTVLWLAGLNEKDVLDGVAWIQQYSSYQAFFDYMPNFMRGQFVINVYIVLIACAVAKNWCAQARKIVLSAQKIKPCSYLRRNTY